MASMIDFSALDFRSALDFAILVEEDAELGYERLARLIGDDPGGAGDVCRMMVVNERKHRLQLEARRGALAAEGAPRIEISVLGEGVERPEADESALPGTARAALEVALAAERRARDFYREAATHAADAAARTLFEELADEEVEHAALLAAKIAALEAMAPRPAEPLPCAVEAPPVACDTYPDGALLASVLPRFDAATQAVAKGVLLEGMSPEAVASTLGVTRSTVVRKLTRFVAVARQHVALAVAVAAMSGCGGGMDVADGAGSALRAGAGAGGRSAAAALSERGGTGAATDVQQSAYSGHGGGAQPGAGAAREADGSPAPDPMSRALPVPQLQADGTQLKPQFAQVSPASGPAEGGAEVLITGSGFSNVQVMFGSVPARVTSQSSNAITVLAPQGERPGTVSVVVTNRDGAYAVAGSAYTYQQE